jgi:hypothetical protein
MMTADMSTTYKGIDYGLGRSNIDNETGIRFGVISQNSINPDAMSEVWDNSRDLSYEQAVENAKREIAACEDKAAFVEWFNENCAGEIDVTDLVDLPDNIYTNEYWTFAEDNFNDAYSMSDCGERDWLYESEGYKLANCLQSDVMVLASPYFTYAQFCSPCVPGACNLDSPLVTPPDWITGGEGFERDWQAIRGNRCYCLGHDYFEGNKAPYPVYSVATGKLVNP